MITTEWLTVATADGPMHMFAAAPGHGEPATGTVVVLQEAFGVNEHIRDVARRLAGQGYRALAPDLFHRTGVAALGYDQYAEAMTLIADIGIQQIVADVGAVLQRGGKGPSRSSPPCARCGRPRANRPIPRSSGAASAAGPRSPRPPPFPG